MNKPLNQIPNLTMTTTTIITSSLLSTSYNESFSSSFSPYRTILLPNLKLKTNHIQRCKIASLKKSKDQQSNPCKPIEYIPMQPYGDDGNEGDVQLKRDGYKIVRNVFKDKERLNFIHRLADVYSMNMFEFVDKDGLFRYNIESIMKDEAFIEEYRKVYGGPFLWQKATIHRKKKKIPKPFIEEQIQQFNKEYITAEHMDITETPNSPLTITAYIAVSDQTAEDTSKLLIYPQSHLEDIKIPVDNFDYVSSQPFAYHKHLPLFCKINSIVDCYPQLDWVRECLYHLIVLDPPEYKVLKSTFLLMLFNPSMFDITPVPIKLAKGDVLFFLSNVLHGSTPHKNELTSRVSLAVRGGYPYYEESSFISECVNDIFYQREQKRQNHFLFSGTPDMIADIHDKHKYEDIIYEI